MDREDIFRREELNPVLSVLLVPEGTGYSFRASIFGSLRILLVELNSRVSIFCGDIRSRLFSLLHILLWILLPSIVLLRKDLFIFGPHFLNFVSKVEKKSLGKVRVSKIIKNKEKLKI